MGCSRRDSDCEMERFYFTLCVFSVTPSIINVAKGIKVDATLLRMIAIMNTAINANNLTAE